MKSIEIKARMLLEDMGMLKNDSVKLERIIAALTPPEGYVLVPLEPTEAMLRAGGWVEPPDAHGQEYIEKQGAAQCWKLMMNARPEMPNVND